MANTIDVAFIKQFETDVHLAYQRMGSKLRNTIRTTNTSASVSRFQKIGTGAASTKSRNGNVTTMELAHTTVEATMADFYAAEYIDKLDELKMNINERQAVAESAASALGRKTDEIIITAMDAGDRKSVVQGKSVDLGGRRIIKKKNNKKQTNKNLAHVVQIKLKTKLITGSHNDTQNTNIITRQRLTTYIPAV